MELAKNLVKSCANQGVYLYIESGKLKYQAPKSALSTDLKEQLISNKPALIEYLTRLEQDANFLNNIDEIKPCSRELPIPASFEQRRMWVADKTEKNEGQYNLFFCLEIKGKLNLQALDFAFSSMVQRHEVLRTSFAFRDEMLVQNILPDINFNIQHHDLTDKANKEELADKVLIDTSIGDFDIEAGALLNVSVITFDSLHHWLLTGIHHIATDGWSMPIWVNELGEFYSSFVENRRPKLPELAIQYADYSYWQHETNNNRYNKSMAFWRERLQDIPQLHNFPIDRKRTAEFENIGENCFTTLDGATGKALEKLANEQGVTLFVLIQTAFAFFISQYSKEQRVVMGTTVSGRNHFSTEPLIGFFVNNVVLTTDIDLSLTFAQQLELNKKGVRESFEHQDIPFDLLLKELKVPANGGYSPLFQIMFSMNRHESYEINLSGLDCEWLSAENHGLVYDLEVDISIQESGIGVNWRYASHLFNESSISRYAENFNQALKYIAAHPNTALTDIPLISTKERDLVISGFNQKSLKHPNHVSVVEIFERTVEQTPERVALVDEEREFTFREINSQANKLARWIVEKTPQPESKIAIYMGSNAELVIAVLAVIKSGAVFLPLGPEVPKSRVEQIISDASPEFILCDLDNQNVFKGFNTTVYCYEHAIQEVVYLPDDIGNLGTEGNRFSKEHVVYTIYTSGTTGKPKGIEVFHKNWSTYYYSIHKEYEIGSDDVVLQLSTPSFDVFIDELTLSIFAGAKLVLKREDTLSSMEHFWKFVAQNKISVLSTTSGLWYVFVDGLTSENIKIIKQHVKYCIIGGESLNCDLLSQWQVAIGNSCHLINAYGPTETTSVSTLLDITEHNTTSQPMTIGKPLANEMCYVLDEKLNPLPINVWGEMYIGGVGVAKGYLNSPELTAEKFLTDPFSTETSARMYRTGDVVRWIPNGEIEYQGRTDDQVKIRGFRVELGEIENALRRYEGVSNALVMPKETQSGTKQLVAYVIPKDSTSFNKERLTATLKQKLSAKLPTFMAPSVFVYVEEFPLGITGKIDKNKLLAINISNVDTETEPAILSPIQKLLLQSFESVLGATGLNIQSNFFDIGGDSIAAIRLLSQTAEYGLKLTIQDLYLQQSVENIAISLENNMSSEERLAAQIIFPISKPGADITVFCLHPLWGGAACFQPLADELGDKVTMYGVQCPDLFTDTRHNDLRELATTYVNAMLLNFKGKPFYLIGYSLGGALAYEVAVQLEECGEDVRYVGSMDCPPMPFEMENARWYTCIENISGKQDWASLEYLSNRERITKLSQIFIDNKEPFVKGISLKSLQNFVEYLMNIQEALFSYQSPKSKLDVSLYLPAGSEDFVDMWKNTTYGAVHLLTVQGDHDNMLGIQNVSELASRFHDELIKNA